MKQDLQYLHESYDDMMSPSIRIIFISPDMPFINKLKQEIENPSSLSFIHYSSPSYLEEENSLNHFFIIIDVNHPEELEEGKKFISFLNEREKKFTWFFLESPQFPLQKKIPLHHLRLKNTFSLKGFLSSLSIKKSLSSQSHISLPDDGLDLKNIINNIENSLITQALEKTDGNKNKASRLLGINRTTLIEKMKKRNISPS